MPAFPLVDNHTGAAFAVGGDRATLLDSRGRPVGPPIRARRLIKVITLTTSLGGVTSHVVNVSTRAPRSRTPGGALAAVYTAQLPDPIPGTAALLAWARSHGVEPDERTIDGFGEASRVADDLHRPDPSTGTSAVGAADLLGFDLSILGRVACNRK